MLITYKYYMLKLRQFIWIFFLLFIGVTLILIGYFKLGLFFLSLSLIGIILKIYTSDKKIKLFSNKWINLYIFMMILYGLIKIFIFQIDLKYIDLIIYGIALIFLYLYFKIVAPKIVRELTKVKNKPVKIGIF